MMKISNILLACTLAAIFTVGCKPAFYHEITAAELEESIGFMASDSLKGRFPGTEEDSVLTAYISRMMDISGLVHAGANGIQEVKVESGYTITSKNNLKVKDLVLNTVRDSKFKVFGFSATDTVEAEIIYMGRTNDLQVLKDDVQGMILFTPLPDSLPSNDYDAYNYLRTASLKAADLGIAGLIYTYSGDPGSFDNPKRLSLPVPVAALDSEHAAELLSLESAEALHRLYESNKVVRSGQKARLETEVIPMELTTYNTVNMLKGAKKELSGQYIIIGAHHDHLGMGGRGSSSRRQDTIAVHYGADDNASGVAGVIELAQNIMSRSPARSFLFTTFAAEELGLFGSKTFANDPLVPLDSVQLMINLDMIGRLNEDRQLQIGGIGTSPVFRSMIDTLNKKANFSIAYSEAGFGPSDHSSFYAKDVPVLFITTGAHPDYHTPADTPDKINYEGMVEVLSFVSDLAINLAELPEKIPFTEAGPKESSGSRGRAGMVTFGLMPDVMYDGNDGMPVSFVTEGKPAAIGGMKSGDIITSVDGKSIGNVYDYMDRLSNLKEGQSVVVTVKRDGTKIDLLLKL